MSPLVDPTRSLLAEAQNICAQRQLTYGPPEVNHRRTAALWSAYLGVEITPRQVCMLNVLQKVSRDRHAAARDNLLDIAGYVANIDLGGLDEGAGGGPAEPSAPAPGESAREERGQ